MFASHSFIKSILLLAGIAALILAIWYFSTIIFYVLAAGVISLIGRPIFIFFRGIQVKRFKLPTAVCAILTLLSFYAVILTVCALFIPLVIEEAHLLSTIDYNQVSTNFQHYFQDFTSFLDSYNNNSDTDTSSLSFIQQKLTDFVSFTSLTALFNSTLGVMGDIIAAFLSITFIAFFFLSDQSLFFKVILLAFPSSVESRVKGVLHNIVQLLSRYFTGILIENILVTFIISLGLYFAGIKNALLIGFFAGLMNTIPYVGPVVSLFFGLVVALTTTLNTSALVYSDISPIILKVVAIMVGTQIVDGTIMQPLIFSKSVKAHPLEIFLVILMSGTLAGIAGMILAVPVYTIFRVVAKEFLSEFHIIQKLTKSI